MIAAQRRYQPRLSALELLNELFNDADSDEGDLNESDSCGDDDGV